MSHPARLSLRAPPHLPFIQGFPGVPGGKDRKQAAVCGTVEVRVGAQPIKAKWVRVEIRKHESLPPGFPVQGDSWELVGEIVTLWQSQGKEFDNLQTADFRFFLPLPEAIPPTVEMAKGTGVWYELVAALSYRKKGGIFKADAANIMKISEPLRITKHELHAVWPVYNNPDQKSVAGQDLTMTIQRPGVAFGPGDRILLTAALRSDRALPFKLRGFECTLLEVVSSIPDLTPSKDKRKSKVTSRPVVKSRPIAQARCAVDESVGRGGEKSARIDMAAPTDILVTVRNARTLEVGYELQVKAVCDGFEGPVVPGIKYVVGQYTRGSAQQATRDIGHVDALCGPLRIAQPPTPPSIAFNTPPSSGTQTPVLQGFTVDPRRISTSTITTTTNTTLDRHGDFSPAPSRNHNTLPARQSLTFPTPHPAPAHLNPISTPTSDSSHAPFDQGNNRYSSATVGTFGQWDRSLQTDTPTPPADFAPLVKPAWDSAEREKMDLYNTARQRAATTQRTGGISLDQLGLADIPDVDVAPPEYAPPVPALPGGKYQAPVRPVSTYVSPDPSISSGLSSPELSRQTSPFDFKSGSGMSGRDGAWVQAVDAGPAPSGSGAGISEKEQRRNLEAKDRGEGSGSGSGVAAPTPALSASTASPTPVLSEKEQMRRYYEAKDKVEKGDGQAGPSAAAAAPLLSEKKQMRRYYEAKDKVESGSGPSGSTVAEPPRSAPLSEKEQMRRYYEARDRVEQTQRGVSSSSSPVPNGISSGSGSSSTPFTLPAGSSYPSASDEKDAMRRRYEEAASRVSRAGTASPPIMDSPPTFSPSTSGPSFRSPTDSPTRASIPSSFASATDEKERMRRLYEDANQRVSRARQSFSPQPDAPPRAPTPPLLSSFPPLAPPVNPATTASSSAGPSVYPSAEKEKESMRIRYAAASSAVSRARASDGGEESGGSWSGGTGARSGTDDDAPPPPLPSRPPAEYINLLSPVSETPPRMGKF